MRPSPSEEPVMKTRAIIFPQFRITQLNDAFWERRDSAPP
jgi:hypothetical protein